MIPSERTRGRWGNHRLRDAQLTQQSDWGRIGPSAPQGGCGERGNRDGSMQDGGLILLPSSFRSLAQVKNPSCVPTDHLEKPHQTRPRPIRSIPAALLDQMKCCILPQTRIKPPSPSGPRLEPLQEQDTASWGEGQGQGWSSTAAVLVPVAGQGLAALQHSTN